MNKLFMLILAAILLTACGNNEEADKPTNQNESAAGETNSENENEKDNDEAIEVEKNLLSVEYTFPAYMIESDSIDQIILEAKADGVDEVIQNSDGSLTFKMLKSKHIEMMKDLEDGLKSSIDEMIYGEDIPSVQDITYNKTFSEFTLTVDRNTYENSFDGLAAISLGMSGMFYQIFDGVNPDNSKVTIHAKDVATGEVFSTNVFPDDLGE